MLTIQSVKRVPSVRVQHDESDGSIVCFVAGNLELHTVDQFREELPKEVDKSCVIFELSAVPFIDSAGLGALVGAIRRIRDDGGDAAVCSARPSVNRVFELVGLSRIVGVCQSVARAKEYLL